MKKNANREVFVKRVRDASGDEEEAVALIEEVRWGDRPACVHCGSPEVYRLMSQGRRNPHHKWKCRACKSQYSVRHGTVFSESRLPLRHWLHAFWRICSSKKGVSALQVSRECGITHKSALFLMHRIRLVMRQVGAIGGGGTTAEADETYVGGKPRFKGVSKPGRGTRKVPVLGVVERGGEVRYRKLPGISAQDIGDALKDSLCRETTLVTDDYSAYNRVAREYLSHQVVKHSLGEYVRSGDPAVHTNTIEGVFALLKRGVYGTFHSVSPKHLPRYLDEFGFRYNHRQITDGERLRIALDKAEGKRMTCQQQLGHSPGG